MRNKFLKQFMLIMLVPYTFLMGLIVFSALDNMLWNVRGAGSVISFMFLVTMLYVIGFVYLAWGKISEQETINRYN